MKQKPLPLLYFFFLIFLRSMNGMAQAVNTQDSLALVDLYNNTNGPGWANKTNWLSLASVSRWYGVTTVNGRVTQLSLTGNGMTGTLPGSIASLPLNLLNLRFNQLSGNIPSALGAMPTLSILQLNNNAFTGPIPVTLAGNKSLNALDLSVNQLTGSIPAFNGLPFLATLDLANNQFSGSLPILANLPSLDLLDVENNQLSGAIPVSYVDLPQFAVFWADHNQLSGAFPESFCYHHFFSILLNDNRLTGQLPDSIIKLSGLFGLNLSNNQFNFAGIAKLKPIQNCIYSPQLDLPLQRFGDTLFVSAGGAAMKETFRLYKDGALLSTRILDSAFKIGVMGKYNIVATDADVPELTLHSDTLNIGLVLPVSTCSASQAVGENAVDVVSGILKLVTLNGLSGGVTVLETIDPVVSTFNGRPFVQRHYDITPASNAGTAQATVTLYFSQADFDAFNRFVEASGVSTPLLPTGGVDNGNIRINQFHGSFIGSAAPGNYTGATVLITPVVSWDAADDWWVVSFPVSGFGGFYMSTGVVPLALTPFQFTGDIAGKAVVLQWKTTGDVNTKQYTIERSSDGKSFNAIGSVSAQGLPGENDYVYMDGKPLAGNNFYRLKIALRDGAFAYGAVVVIRESAVAETYLVYPNPVHGMVSVLFHSAGEGKYSIQVVDGLGRILQVLNGVSAAGVNKVEIDMGAYTAGTYTLVISDAVMVRRSLRVTKE
jgi:Secretion system C-terminal sorting domain/Leucine rich repeat